ncbi:P-loop containing nucleoside triphosphate hydrolase protein [Microthyrium microscopicum]|uniref:P-loop containing nucleoside triphosphate hydrolase protein n=1 Tax=Microthyrium microscopicum TaxID=703497 RepID=A0A6A6UJA1_9PEZI|nr:P-loop containing nucleoside triphosphate hydrolase protein [Microthyrium microscopicum]
MSIPSAFAPSRVSAVAPKLSSIVSELRKRQAAVETGPSPATIEVDKLRKAAQVVVALMGVTGSGKSSFIRRVTCNDDIRIGGGLQSMTQQVQSFHCEIGQAQFSLVDTPGFNDTYISDTDILKELASWLLESYQGGTKLNGIIYLHRISDTRMEGSSLRNLRMFRKLCGDEFMKNVVLGTTFWDMVNEETGLAREAELLDTDGFFKEMKALGCDVVRITKDRDQNLKLLTRFENSQPSVMRIQRELLEGKSLAETAAAATISPEMAELQRINNVQAADVQYQTKRRVTISSLEMLLTRKLRQDDFENTIEKLATHQEQLRQEGEEQAREQQERLVGLRQKQKNQAQIFQVQMSELDEKLRRMKAKENMA